MKRKLHIIIILLSVLISGLTISSKASNNPIQMHKKGMTNNHSGIPFVPVDMPDIYYDDQTQVITIDGNGYSAYYYVDIISESTLLTMFSTNVDGDYGTVDVSSLPDDNYTIIITSSENNQYEGQFTNY